MKKLAIAIATFLVILAPVSAEGAHPAHAHGTAFHHSIDWD